LQTDVSRLADEIMELKSEHVTTSAGLNNHSTNSYATAAVTEDVSLMNNHESLQQNDNAANFNKKVDRAVYRAPMMQTCAGEM